MDKQVKLFFKMEKNDMTQNIPTFKMELPKMKTDHYQPLMFDIDHYYLFKSTKNK